MTFSASEYLFLSQKFSDVTFIVENQSIPAHKMLMASCPYFQTVLFGSTNESKMSFIELKNVSYKTFLEVLRCIYQGKVDISNWTPEEVKKLVQIADEYQFPAMGSVIAESINVDTQIEDILEDVVDVATRLKCVPLMEKCAASVRRSVDVLLTDKEAFDKLPMELICYLIDTGFWHPADKRLVFAIGNWRKTASIEAKKRLLSKIEWKSLPGNYSEPLVRMFLDNDEDGLQDKGWTDGLAHSNAFVDLIAGAYTTYNGHITKPTQLNGIPYKICALTDKEMNGSVVIFFREQLTTVTKIKLKYDKNVDITLILYGNNGATEVRGTKINENWEFILPTNTYFSAAALNIYNREFKYSEYGQYAEHNIFNLQFLHD